MPRDMALPPDLNAIATRHRVFNPADGSVGYAARLRSMLDDMDERREMIEAALSYTPGTHTFDQLVAMVQAGHLTLWPLPHSFMLTEIHQYPSARHYHIFLAGGDLDELVSMHTDVIEVAKALQCDKLTLTGRAGWARALKSYDWTPSLITVTKDI
jgi:hypothetical protein